MASFAERMRELSNAHRSNFIGNDDTTLRYKKAAIDIFFNTIMEASRIQDIIQREAMHGHLSAIIYEYDYYDYFYIDDRNQLKFILNFTPGLGYQLYKIHTTLQDPYFKGLMDSFIGENMGMVYDYTRMTYVSKLRNGIEVCWGTIEDSRISKRWFDKLINKIIGVPPPPVVDPIPNIETNRKRKNLDRDLETYFEETSRYRPREYYQR